VCGICLKILLRGKSPYGKSKIKNLSSYQRKKFISIFWAQLLFFFLIPYLIPALSQSGGFFNDVYKPLNKNSYIYVYNAFTSLGGFFYIFILVPVTVYFFGKRYCSWFCACGNLAETVGVTSWGRQWVQKLTPRGRSASRLEIMQLFFLILACGFGLLLFLDSWKVLSASSWIQTWRFFQDLVVDLIFGALIGVRAYPFLGTRIWCRYGCPLAQSMKLFGAFSRSRFKVNANKNCRGINLCTQACPMGIDVASYAHRGGVPLEGSFDLKKTPCIGCGGCIDICPEKALSFEKIGKAKV
jgi:polyferredoxin